MLIATIKSVMLSVIMLTVVMLNVVMMNVVAPSVRLVMLLICTEAVCLVRCLGRSQLVPSLSPPVNELLGGILSWAQTLIRLFTERQLSHKVHAYLVHNSCLTHSQGTKNTKIKLMPISVTVCA